MKRTVSPTSSISRATSLGVFCRFALSTMEIMWSRKVSPGLAVIITFICPRKDARAACDGAPVPLCLPYDRGRFAGHGRLVDEGHPLDDLAVPGYRVPVFYQHHVAFPKREGGTFSTCPSAFTLRPYASVCAFRSVSACALPLPSARASAKLAKSTVNQSHRAYLRRLNQKGPPEMRLSTEIREVTTETHLHHEHDGVSPQEPGVEPAESARDRRSREPRLPDGYLLLFHCAP